MNADAMIGWVALIVIVIVIAVFLRARSSSTTGANTRSNGDPLAEAEVYLAYGKKKEAIEILSAALGRYPDREDIRVKLNAVRHDF